MLSTDSTAHIDVIARLDRAIQYAATVVLLSDVSDYWMPAFAGMTSRDLGEPT
jgi:hypothetical protein